MEALSPHFGPLLRFSLFTTVVCLQCGREAFPSHEAESLPSHRGQAACLLLDIHLVGCMYADSSLFFLLCFQIIRVLQCNEKMLLGSQ